MSDLTPTDTIELLPEIDRLCWLKLADGRLIVGARVMVDPEEGDWYWAYQSGSLEWSSEDGWTCGLIGEDLDVKTWTYLPEPTE